MRARRDLNSWENVADPTKPPTGGSGASDAAETGQTNVEKYEGLIHDMVKGESVQEQPAEVPVDAINPAHYRGFTDGAEVIQITEHLSFNRGNAVKYLARAGKKELARELEDLEKALWYVQREINRVRNTK